MLLCGTVAVIMVTAGYAPGCYWRLCSKMASELSLTLERGGILLGLRYQGFLLLCESFSKAWSLALFFRD